jgi:pyruvate dehydrogenase E2 component (dihydrolipoamide acetyltransferase)
VVPTPAAKAPAALSPAVWGGAQAPADERIPLDKLRTAIGRRMVESKQQVPHFYVTHNYNVEPLLELRTRLNALLPDDAKLTVNDFIIKAVALALRRFPNINASLQGSEIVRHGHVNVGVAVAIGGGLLTIVTKDTDLKPLRVISNEVREMVARARAGKVKPDDIEGSTFSISNLGMFDVEHFVAIINPPEAAILAVGSAQKVPAVVGGEVIPQMRMKATISADHRVTDGAEAAQFMQALAEYIEEPMRLVL